MARLLVVLALVLAACGDDSTLTDNEPSIEEIEEEGIWVERETPDGDPLWCLYFADNGYNRAWLAYTCVPRYERGER